MNLRRRKREQKEKTRRSELALEAADRQLREQQAKLEHDRYLLRELDREEKRNEFAVIIARQLRGG